MKSLFLWMLLFSIPLNRIIAIYNPLSVPNNKYGIHIADTNDIPDLPALVNSSGGDWGYVTLVIQDNDRNFDKWQAVFNQLRRLHLIPIVRLATQTDGPVWKKPLPEDGTKWADFLSKLNWPVENRYVILFNEPNHAKEWGGILDPEGYAHIALTFAQAFKASSEDYFILPAGMDASASSDGFSLDAAQYISRMYRAQPELFTLLNGWTSHSYPNPGFSASPYASGKGSIRSYAWELNFLKQLGIAKSYPVFITETGWGHTEGKFINQRLLPSKLIGDYLQTAAGTAWTDFRIAAVTPFIFNYQDVPFDHFSWKMLQTDAYYDQYYSYRAISKIKGGPKQRDSFFLEHALLPDTLVADSTYTFETVVLNTGQSILDPDDGFALTLDGETESFVSLFDPLPYAEPNEKGILHAHIKTPHEPGTYELTVSLIRRGSRIALESKKIRIIPPPSATLHVRLGWKKQSDTANATVLVFDDSNRLLHTVRDSRISGGIIRIQNLTSVVPGSTYRIVLLAPYYLPRQTITSLLQNDTDIYMRRMIPLDFHADGTLSIRDLFALFFRRPHDVLSLFL